MNEGSTAPASMRVRCEKTTAQLLEYVEGTLTPSVRDQLAAHFHTCAPCQRLLESYQCTAALCREVLQNSVPPGFHDRLLAHLRLQRKSGH